MIACMWTCCSEGRTLNLLIVVIVVVVVVVVVIVVVRTFEKQQEEKTLKYPNICVSSIVKPNQIVSHYNTILKHLIKTMMNL